MLRLIKGILLYFSPEIIMAIVSYIKSKRAGGNRSQMPLLIIDRFEFFDSCLKVKNEGEYPYKSIRGPITVHPVIFGSLVSLSVEDMGKHYFVVHRLSDQDQKTLENKFNSIVANNRDKA